MLCDLLDAPTALAGCCGFDLCHKYILYLYLYLYLVRCALLVVHATRFNVSACACLVVARGVVVGKIYQKDNTK